MLGIFQMPNRFFEADGRAVDFLGNDWERTWRAPFERAEQARFAATEAAIPAPER
jgi:hypothetical protein